MLPLVQQGLGSAAKVALVGMATLPMVGAELAEIAVKECNECRPYTLEVTSGEGSLLWMALMVLIVFIVGYGLGKSTKQGKQADDDKKRDIAARLLRSYDELKEIMANKGFSVTSTRLTKVLMAEVIVVVESKAHVGTYCARSKGMGTSGGKD